MKTPDFDVVIIGGSYAGLSAAMALGRAVRRVLILDSGQPCNRQTPHSHNLITQDGATPAHITAVAKEQVLAYPTVRFQAGTATAVMGESNSFVVETAAGEQFRARKILFATGVRDLLPAIPGFAESWGISVIHCRRWILASSSATGPGNSPCSPMAPLLSVRSSASSCKPSLLR